MYSPSSEIGKRLRTLRESAGISQRALSLAAGLTHTVVHQVERNVIEEPSVRLVRGLAAALGVPVAWLLEGTGEEPSPGQVARHFAKRSGLPMSDRVVRISDGKVFSRSEVKCAVFRKRDGRGKGPMAGFSLLPHDNTDPIAYAAMVRAGDGYRTKAEDLRDALERLEATKARPGKAKPVEAKPVEAKPRQVNPQVSLFDS